MQEFVLAVVVACLYVMIKVVERRFSRYSKNEGVPPLKVVIREAILVCLVTAAGALALRYLRPVLEPAPPVTLAFTDNPPF